MRPWSQFLSVCSRQSISSLLKATEMSRKMHAKLARQSFGYCLHLTANQPRLKTQTVTCCVKRDHLLARYLTSTVTIISSLFFFFGLFFTTLLKR